jgi:hypothetical protein
MNVEWWKLLEVCFDIDLIEICQDAGLFWEIEGLLKNRSS